MSLYVYDKMGKATPTVILNTVILSPPLRNMVILNPPLRAGEAAQKKSFVHW